MKPDIEARWEKDTLCAMEMNLHLKGSIMEAYQAQPSYLEYRGCIHLR